MRIRNLKGFALEIGATGQVVEPDGEAEVADTLGASLLAQADVWAAVTPNPEPKPADIEEQA